MIKLFDLHFSIIFQVIIIASYLIHKKGTFIIKIIKTVYFYTIIFRTTITTVSILQL